MALEVGTNCITKSEDKIRSMLADAVSFRAWVGASDVEHAKEKVFVNEMNLPHPAWGEEYTLEEWRCFFPMVMLEPLADEPEMTIVQYAIGSQWEYAVNLAFLIRFQRYETPGYANYEDLRLFKNEVGGIIEELHTLAHLHFGFTQLAATAPVTRGEYDGFEKYGTVLSWPWAIRRENVG